MNYETIKFKVENGYASLLFNRPKSLNSFNTRMHQETADALAQVARNKDIRALLITGAGRAFCAGQDLADISVDSGQAPVDIGEILETWYNPLIRRIRDLPMPVLCAVNGVAAGAGANIALACDLVIAADSAKFIQAFCKIGLLPDSGGTWILPRLVGIARAKALMLLGTPLSAADAVDWGLIYKVVPADELLHEAQQLCAHLATQPTLALAAIKNALAQSFTNELNSQLDIERDLQHQLGNSDDYQEGASAFLEKRAPHFNGK